MPWLNQRGISAVIFSNHTYKGIKFQLERLKIDKYFNMVLARDIHNGPVEKRIKGAMLEKYIESQKYNKTEVLIVADGIEEIEIGKTLGISCVAISGGYTSTIRLKGAQPDYLIHNVTELKSIIIKHN